MSVCTQGFGDDHECPALHWTGYDGADDECGFGIFSYTKEDRDAWPAINKMPDTCELAPILRVLRSASDKPYRLATTLKALEGDYASRIGMRGYHQEIFVPYIEQG